MVEHGPLWVSCLISSLHHAGLIASLLETSSPFFNTLEITGKVGKNLNLTLFLSK